MVQDQFELIPGCYTSRDEKGTGARDICSIGCNFRARSLPTFWSVAPLSLKAVIER